MQILKKEIREDEEKKIKNYNKLIGEIDKETDKNTDKQYTSNSYRNFIVNYNTLSKLEQNYIDINLSNHNPKHFIKLSSLKNVKKNMRDKMVLNLKQYRQDYKLWKKEKLELNNEIDNVQTKIIDSKNELVSNRVQLGIIQQTLKYNNRDNIKSIKLINEINGLMKDKAKLVSKLNEINKTKPIQKKIIILKNDGFNKIIINDIDYSNFINDMNLKFNNDKERRRNLINDEIDYYQNECKRLQSLVDKLINEKFEDVKNNKLMYDYYKKQIINLEKQIIRNIIKEKKG